MKKYLIVMVAAMAIVFAACVKDLEKYGFSETTTLRGKVIDEKNGYVPVSSVTVSITNGTRTYESYMTEADGRKIELLLKYEQNLLKEIILHTV